MIRFEIPQRWIAYDGLAIASALVELKALVRDVNSLAALGAVKVERLGEGRYRLGVRLEWPAEITETAFFEKLRQLPKAKTHSFLR